MKQFNARIAKNRPVCIDFYELEFAWDPDAPVPSPGQFFTVRVSQDSVPLLRRPFAFSAINEKTRTASMIYQRRGRGTEILTGKRKGDLLDVLGPLGRPFTLPERGQKALLVAGGIGIGPMLFLAGALKRQGIDSRMVFGCRTSALVPDMAVFSRFKPAVCTDDGSAGFKGTTGDFCKTIEKEIGGDTVLYACGPMAMLKSCHEFAVRRGIPCHVSVEQIMACGVGACMGCAIRAASGGYLRVCSEGPVFGSKEIAWD